VKPVDWSKHVGNVGKVGDWHGTRELLVRGPRPPAGVLHSAPGMHLERIMGRACLMLVRTRSRMPQLPKPEREAMCAGRSVHRVAGAWWDAEGLRVVGELAACAVVIAAPLGPWGEPRSVIVGFGVDGMACVMLVQREGAP
jgi:hypothetical protein